MLTNNLAISEYTHVYFLHFCLIEDQKTQLVSNERILKLKVKLKTQQNKQGLVPRMKYVRYSSTDLYVVSGLEC